ncbi:MAG: lipopolysaccharide heptosyltransferase I [Magnetococcales bacterium]|nr:lipopolysaccharide heptosyltransferase I [Magnetococcales bacterium]
MTNPNSHPNTVLLLKTSSLGDIIHTLPAITDAKKQLGDIKFHWVVEENFAEIPTWHPAVEKVISFVWRRVRKNLFAKSNRDELQQFYSSLRENRYHKIIDNQGLLKSAIPASLAHGPVWGLDYKSAREPIASLFYNHKMAMDKAIHAITKNRMIFAQALNYSLPQTPVDYGVKLKPADMSSLGVGSGKNYYVFLHSTTWASKHWPEEYWFELCKIAGETSDIMLPWGNNQEKERATRLVKAAPKRCHVTPKLTLTQLASLLANSKGVVSVDTGPAHLAAAVGSPTICLYGPTDPAKIGTTAQNHKHLTGSCDLAPCKKRNCPLPKTDKPQPACFQVITPKKVFERLRAVELNTNLEVN